MRIFLISLALLYFVGVSYARQYLLGPDLCALHADVADNGLGGDMAADDLNSWRATQSAVAPVVEVERQDDGSDKRISAWVVASINPDPSRGRGSQLCGG